MPSVRLPFIAGGALNMANSPVYTGQSEPITGIALPSGLTPGAYFDMTEAEAAQSSNATIDTLHEGRYQWVQLDSGATAAGTTGGLQRGQQLFWKDPPFTSLPLGAAAYPTIPYPNQYIVTNRTQDGAQSVHLAGIVINDATISPVTPGNWFWMQAIAPGRGKVKLASALTGASTPSATVVITKNAGAGADLALADVITTVTAVDPRLWIGTLEAQQTPSASQLVMVDFARVNGPAI